MNFRILLTTGFALAAASSALASGARAPDQIGKYNCSSLGKTDSIRLPHNAVFWGDYFSTVKEAEDSAIKSCRQDYRYIRCELENCYKVDAHGELQNIGNP